MLITEEYKTLNEKLHETNKHYGTSGHKWTQRVINFTQMVGSQDVLDYGCGKSTLAQNLPFAIKQYDPAVQKYCTPPQPADIVICTDVLEHVEPACVVDVLRDLCRLTKNLCFIGVANHPAAKTLADGRNAHLIQENELFWLGHILPLFHLLQFNSSGISADPENAGKLEYVMVLSPRIQL